MKQLFLQLIAVFILSFAPCSAVIAQDDTRVNNSNAVDDFFIVITAQKREQNIQDVPLSIFTTSGDELDAIGISDISAIAHLTPNVTIDNAITGAGSSGVTSLFIRGVGQSDFLMSTDPGVGLYLDGAYILRSVGSLLDIVDIERVEVLRGPQGILYGKNTTGGAINVISKQPSDEEKFSAKLTLGTDNNIDTIISTNVPLSDNLYSKFTLASFNQDGYINRPLAGDKLGDDDSIAARIAFLYQPSKSISISLSTDYTRSREQGSAETLLNTYLLCPTNVLAPFCEANAPSGAPPGQSFLFNHIPAVNPSLLTAAPDLYDNRWLPDDNYTSYGTGQHISDLDTLGSNLTIDWKLPAFDIKSITAYRTLESFYIRDADQSPLPIVSTFSDIEQSQFSQEIQISGHSDENNLTWLLGGYYMKEEAVDSSQPILATLIIQSGGDRIDTESKAIFVQTTYNLTDVLALTGGIRYTVDDKAYSPTQFIQWSHPALIPPQPPSGAIVVPANTNYLDFSKTTYKLGLDYHHSDKIMSYLSYSTGFKSGGFVQRNQAAKPWLPTFEPEEVSVIEAGFKSTLLDDHLLLNGSLFHSDYENIQVKVVELSGFAPITANAAEGEVTGMELEFKALVTNNLSIAGGLGYMDAKYTKVGANLADIKLNSKFTNTPQKSLNSSIIYDYESDWGLVTSRLDWSYQSEVYNNSENTPEFMQDPLHLLNASITYQQPETGAFNWYVSLGIRNLTDEEYIVSGESSRSFGNITATFARKRQWYLSVGINY